MAIHPHTQAVGRGPDPGFDRQTNREGRGSHLAVASIVASAVSVRLPGCLGAAPTPPPERSAHVHLGTEY